MKAKSKTNSTKKALVSDRTIEKVSQQARLTTSYLVFMVTAGVLAAVALLTNSIPVLIGSMVISPCPTSSGISIISNSS